MNIPDWEKDFLLIDFLKGRIEYNPHIYKIRFVWKIEDEPLINSKIFFNYRTACKLDLFCQFLLQSNQRAWITIIFYTQKIIKIKLNINIADFPVTDLARTLKIESVLERGIPAMDVSINSMKGMEITDQSFYDWLDKKEPKTQISISSLNPDNMETLMEDFITIPAGIIKAGSII